MKFIICFVLVFLFFEVGANAAAPATCHDFTGSWKGTCKYSSGTIQESYYFLGMSPSCEAISFYGTYRDQEDPFHLKFLNGRTVTVTRDDETYFEFEKSKSWFLTPEQNSFKYESSQFTKDIVHDVILSSVTLENTIALVDIGLEVTGKSNENGITDEWLCFFSKRK